MTNRSLMSALAFSALVACLGGGQASAEQALQIWAGQPAKLVHSLALAPRQVFALEHRNSIYDAPVRETYMAGAAGNLIQLSLESPSAGVFEYHGYSPPASGKVSLMRHLGEIRLLSTSYHHHHLVTGGRSLNLAKLAEAGSPVIIRITDTPAASGVERP